MFELYKGSSLDYVKYISEEAKNDSIIKRIDEGLVDWYYIFKDGKFYSDFSIDKTDNSIFWLYIKVDAYKALKEILNVYENLNISIPLSFRKTRKDELINILKDNDIEITRIVKTDTSYKLYLN